jgi:hypothetical protein
VEVGVNTAGLQYRRNWAGSHAENSLSFSENYPNGVKTSGDGPLILHADYTSWLPGE